MNIISVYSILISIWIIEIVLKLTMSEFIKILKVLYQQMFQQRAATSD